MDTGPYRHIRHPIYVSFFLFVVALFLINISLITFLVASALVVFYFYYWLPREEKSLRAKIPGYAEYMERTPRFFPRLWRG